MKRNKRLTEAVRIAQNAEIEELEKQISEDGEHVFSADFEEKMNSLFEKKKEPTAKYQYFKRAAVAFCCLAVALSFVTFSGSFLGNKEKPWYVDWAGESATSIVYEPAYVPSGYEFYGREVTDETIKTEYRNSSGESIFFEQSKNLFDDEIPFDVQYSGYDKSVSEVNRRLIQCYKKDNTVILIWNVPDYIFRVSGTADYEEIIKMCDLKETEIKK